MRQNLPLQKLAAIKATLGMILFFGLNGLGLYVYGIIFVLIELSILPVGLGLAAVWVTFYSAFYSASKS